MANTNGRQASEAPSSSSSDLYTAHTAEPITSQPPATNGFHLPPKPAQIQAQPILEDDGDCSSEMDVSDASSSVAPAHLDAGPAHAGAKRKLSVANLVDASPANIAQDIVKKPRISLPIAKPGPSLLMTAGWPPEIWQQVFTHLSPAMLSRCLRVCRSFKFCLTELKAPTVPRKKDTPLARVLESEALWTQARKHAYPTMPRPLLGFSELQMLQLVGGTSCLSCGKPHTKSTVTNVFNAGPGESGVRVIWPFRVRLCGNCFVNESLTDIQMLSTKHPAAPLTRGLPYAFRTPDGHFVPDHIRQSPNGMPAQTRLQKTFYRKDVDNITAEVEEVNSFGDGAADEWRKGMTQRGKDAMADSSRWERWEGTMPTGKMPAEVLREYDLASFPRLLDQQQRQQRQTTSQYAHVGGALAAPPFHGTHPLPQPVHVFANTQPHLQHHTLPPAHPPPHVQRPVRNAHEVEAARQARRADIERRCLELDPPLQPNALQHIKAFRDTMQITTPMTDLQWENMLKPKIQEEREAAELQEHQRAQQLAALQAAIPSTVSDEAFTRPAKEVYDRDYEHSQEPLRQKLGEYASDHINGHWLQGRALDRDSAPLFAVDVLLHVRQRYIADRDAGLLDSVIKDAPKFHLAKQSTPPLEPFLSLDNMKWVFDNKVRTYTDSHRRELFICAGCAEDRKPKWFAFEGLIQHYGAKHTSAFSKGNVVVHWQTAEWPDEPPFFENPATFVKAERKFTGAKAHGRSRGTPQGSVDETVRSPAPVAMLSDNPVFSAKKSPASGQNGHHPVDYPPGGYGYQYQPPVQPKPDYSKASQVAKVSADAREIWDQLDGVKELQEALECVRMFTVLHHMVGRFMLHFGHAPLLDTVTDALATNELMKPIKSTHALACKICTAKQNDGTPDQFSYYARIRKMKMYNISALVTHFKLTHQPDGVLSWDLNLIELPDNALVGELIRKPGMDDKKLKLIAAAFPDAFPSPLPHIGTVSEAPPDPGPDTGLASRLVKKLTKGQPQGKKKRKGQNFAHERNVSIEPSTDSREEEYDPRRPMFVEKKKAAEFDPSRFDTDLARKDEPLNGRANGSANGNANGTINLAPETLVALNALQVHSTATPDEPETRYSTPSIRRSDSRPASAQDTAPPSLPQVTPDIAAILATLTGQTQGAAASTAPSATSIQGPSRTPRQPPYEQYAPPVQHTSPAYVNHESRRPQSHYVSGGSYPSSVEPAPARYDGQDLQAALSRNAQHYAQNGHASYVEAAPAPVYASTAPAPAPASAPVYAAHPARSPPRYRVIYEDEPAYPQPRPHPHYQQPYDGQPAPIQYVPIPESSHPYRYEQYPPPPPKPIYVDQYGRPVEFIPIDAAPAPVQYMPHPYDLQQQQQQQQYARPPAAYAGAPQYSALPTHQQPAVYYEPAPPHAHQGRYVYEDDGRGSVPRA